VREAIGGTWLFQIVIVFVLLFTGYMCLTINHSKAFNVKNTIINAIERENGVDLSNPSGDAAMQTIVEYLQNQSYRTTGTCPSGYTGYNRDGAVDSRNSAICIKETTVSTSSDLPYMSYYSVIVFYQLDLPIFSETFNFKVSGDTKLLSSSYRTNGYYKTANGLCQKYQNGKKSGNPVSCSGLSSSQIIGG
jgi:hypothetical protein